MLNSIESNHILWKLQILASMEVLRRVFKNIYKHGLASVAHNKSSFFTRTEHQLDTLIHSSYTKMSCYFPHALVNMYGLSFPLPSVANPWSYRHSLSEQTSWCCGGCCWWQGQWWYRWRVIRAVRNRELVRTVSRPQDVHGAPSLKTRWYENPVTQQLFKCKVSKTEIHTVSLCLKILAEESV